MGNFNNIGCFVDTNSARVLKADSTTSAEMTVEKCVAETDRDDWRYAGLEAGGQCFVGNTLHNGNAKPTTQDKCNTVCGGDTGELCGGSLYIQIYQDSTWSDPNAAELASEFQEYNDTLAEFHSVVLDYQAALKDWQSETGSSNPKLRPRQATLTPSMRSIIRRMKNGIMKAKPLGDRIGT